MCFKNKNKLTKLIMESENRIEKMLDISKMMRNNRLFKILLKNAFLNMEVSQNIKHTEKYLIDLDSSISDTPEDNENENI